MNRKEMEEAIEMLGRNQTQLIEDIDKMVRQLEEFAKSLLKPVENHYHYYYSPPDMVKTTGPKWEPHVQPATGDPLPEDERIIVTGESGCIHDK